MEGEDAEKLIASKHEFVNIATILYSTFNLCLTEHFVPFPAKSYSFPTCTCLSVFNFD